MKALIKYLPIGNNKAPIIRLHPELAYIIYAQNEQDYRIKVDKINRGDRNGFEKAKFFAVTQDIKVGDEIFCPNYLSGASYFTATDILPNGSIEVSNVGRAISIEESKDCFKILGEVSIEATFVKDDKEYEVQGVKRFTGNTEPFGNTVSHEYKLVFEVKCPCCGTFK